MSKPRIERFVDWFIGTYMPDHGLQFGSGTDEWLSDPDRMQRCDDAAANGADGSTHAEIISDWRRGFRHYLRFRSGKRNPFSAGHDRFETAVNAHFNEVEQWHKDHGSLDEQVG